jgi:uncharacterized phosphosugar-binding protein
MSEFALVWLKHARSVIDRIEEIQTAPINKAAGLMAESIETEYWTHHIRVFTFYNSG